MNLEDARTPEEVDRWLDALPDRRRAAFVAACLMADCSPDTLHRVQGARRWWHSNPGAVWELAPVQDAS